MSDQKNSGQQDEFMRRMLELAEQQLEQSFKRTRLSEERSRLSVDRSRMSAERSEMSEGRSYHNAERTLSVWVRTALSLMVFGIAIDRFGLLLHEIPGGKNHVLLQSHSFLGPASFWGGAALVMLGVIMSLSTAVRFWVYAIDWQKKHTLPAHHGPCLATFFAAMVGIFGLLLLILMMIFTA